MPDEPTISPELLERIGHDTGRHLFVPAHFDLSGPDDILAFIEHNPLAHLISAGPEDTHVTAAALIHDQPVQPAGEAPQIPQIPKEQFLGHLARRNPHAEVIRRGSRGVALIKGPDAYISPRWNVERPSLPTWSYVSVQLRGVFEPVTDLDETRTILERTIAHMERAADTPWSLDDAPPELVAALIEHILAFRFKVDDMQGIARLNQNRRPADRSGIIGGLRHRGDPGSVAIADLMAEALGDDAPGSQ